MAFVYTCFEMFSGEGRRDFTKKNQGGNLRITPFGPLRCFEISKPSLKISIVCIIRQIHGPWSDVLVLRKDQIFPTFCFYFPFFVYGYYPRDCSDEHSHIFP